MLWLTSSGSQCYSSFTPSNMVSDSGKRYGWGDGMLKYGYGIGVSGTGFSSIRYKAAIFLFPFGGISRYQILIIKSFLKYMHKSDDLIYTFILLGLELELSVNSFVGKIIIQNYIIYMYNNMSQRFRGTLQENNKFVRDEIQMIASGARLSIAREVKPRERDLRRDLTQLVRHVAKTGQIQPDLWIEYRNFLTIMIKETLDRFQQQYKDSNTFEEEKEVILQYLVFFDKTPFTIQRISQLTLQPQKYYKSSRKLLYAFQKLVNVSDPQQK